MVTDVVIGHRDVEVTLFDQPQFKGQSLYLPGASPDQLRVMAGMPDELHFPLLKYDFENKASSMVVKVRGAVPPPPPRGTPEGDTGTTHRAAAAGDTTEPVQMKVMKVDLGPVNIAGTWKSNIALVYEITQNADRFTWTVVGGHQTARGTISGQTLNVTWADESRGNGSAKGTIVLDSQGKAVRIQWSNGVVFTR